MAVLGASALVATLATTAAPAAARGDGGHGFGRMGPSSARTTSVNPASGPDFELPFVCGQRWTGSTRSSHSPSSYTVDFNAPNDLGQPVVASAPGVVVRVTKLRYSYGNHVIVDHGGGYSTLYAHLRNITTVVGTHLDQGDLIGRLGTSGNSTGPHLHFEQRKDGAYFPPYFHRTRFGFGSTVTSANCGDRPVAGDWDGDGSAQIGIYRPSAGSADWWLSRATGGWTKFAFGGPNDSPFTGSWDGEAGTEVGYRRLMTTAFTMRSPSGAASSVGGVGSAVDTVVSGDWDGDGVTDVGSYRASDHTFRLRRGSGQVSTVTWGAAGDRAVAGDWSRRGYDEVGVFDQETATWRLRVRRANGYATRTVAFGSPGDLPVTGDWNGDGVTDLGTWTPDTATFTLRTPGAGGYQTTTRQVGIPR